MTTSNQAELFTAILDQLDQRAMAGAARHGHEASAEDEHEDDDVAPEPIRPKALATSKDWLLQLLGSMARHEPASAEPPADPSSAYEIEPEAEPQVEPHVEPAAEPIEIEATAVPEDEPEPTDETIAAELHLDAITTSRDLRKLRRNFARANHPDRFGHDRAALATRRMTIANMLIDRRIRELAKPHWSFPWRG